MRVQCLAERTLKQLEVDQSKLTDDMSAAQAAFGDSLEAMAQVGDGRTRAAFGPRVLSSVG